MPSLTPIMIEQAKALRAEGYGWLAIGKKLQVSEYIIRCELEPAFHQYRIAQARKARNFPRSQERTCGAEKTPAPDQARRSHEQNRSCRFWQSGGSRRVLRERDVFMERSMEQRDLTAILLGDPVKGRSALDKRQGK